MILFFDLLLKIKLNCKNIMKITMFDYTKSILERVSFDPDLFCKEVQKAMQFLLPYEVKEITIWILAFIKEKPELQLCQTYLIL